MIKKLFVSTFAIALLGVISCNAGNPGDSKQTAETKGAVTTEKGKTVHLTDDSFKKLVFDYQKNKQWKYEGNKPAIVDFYANWCGPCRVIAPILDELAKEYDGKLIIYKVDTDKERQLSQALGIQSLPTLVFIPVDGAPQAILGAQPKTELVKAINDILLTKSK